ncbi:Lrp/AsnC family transcriptional regulator [Vagococcus entomophilus]|uniref:AsnC family transcriptional regulator n=1 Tax=Vagococcus entomophilus TaxID=1160095 RepID=A0A430AIH6_9ENTE|nr:Lrp/AsnC family transcriptional regulator [Vagococcus entomophilus]RSU07926.1 AsnC family transcriptional regulator [Vagococcus entomophilus]
MDQIDKEILNCLNENARMSLKKIAERCFVSSPAVSARIHRLEEEKIITSYGIEVDYKKIGFHIKAFISVQIDPQQKDSFYPFIDSCQNVLECDCVTGEYAMLLKVVFPSTDELDQFIGLLQKYGKTYTQIVFSTPVRRRGMTYYDKKESET